VQAGLGGLTVEKNLKDVLVAAHLGTAMLLLGTLIALSWAARPGSQGRVAIDAGALPRRLAIAASAIVLATIVAGGYIAGTEEEGIEGGAVGGAHLACGTQFPQCNDSLFPFGESRLTDVQLVHRALMAASVLAIAAFLIAALRRRVRSSLLWVLPALLAAQVLLGAVNVWAGKHPGLVVAHLTLGTTLWATMLVAALQFVRVPSPQPTLATGRTERATAPA
jgi:heme A synthase